MSKRKHFGISSVLPVLLLSAGLVACDGGQQQGASSGGDAASSASSAPADSSAATPAAPAGSGGSITGAGASFPFPLYSKMFAEYGKLGGVNVNYQSVGSGTGQRQIIERTVDFGASDNPMSDEQIASAPSPIAHIPMALGAVAVTYNIPGLAPDAVLKMNGTVLAEIFLGKITTWNDPAILAINEGLTLPPLPITVARRSDSSGTSAVFTEFLSKTNTTWKDSVGSGNSVNWPTGSAAKGNDGVANLVRTTPGSIGYVEEAFAHQNQLPTAALQNVNGDWVQPNLEGVRLAAASSPLPDDFRGSVTNASGAGAYPIASYTYLLVYPDQGYRSREDGERLQKLLEWMLTDGQSYHEPLHYASLPENVAEAALKVVRGMTHNGEPLLKN